MGRKANDTPAVNLEIRAAEIAAGGYRSPQGWTLRSMTWLVGCAFDDDADGDAAFVSACDGAPSERDLDEYAVGALARAIVGHVEVR